VLHGAPVLQPPAHALRKCRSQRLGGGLNWYAFCSNNPVSNTDPFGLCRQAPNLVDVPDPWNPLSWSWDEWVDAANAAKAGVGDPIGTAAGLMIYGDVPGTVKIVLERDMAGT